jgi:hypothetical protein
MSYVIVASRAFLFVVMMFAVVGKLSSGEAWRSFVASLAAFGVLRPAGWSAVAVLIALAEMAVVVLLVPHSGAVYGLALGTALIGGFSLAVVAARAAGREIRCRCFGSDGGPMGRPQLVRNAILLTVALLGLLALATGQPDRPAAGPASAVAAVATLAAIGVTYRDEVAILLRRDRHPSAR